MRGVYGSPTANPTLVMKHGSFSPKIRNKTRTCALATSALEVLTRAIRQDRKAEHMHPGTGKGHYFHRRMTRSHVHQILTHALRDS